MKILHSFSEAKKEAEIRQLALGFFDGLHIGHAAVILPKKGVKNSKECGLLTFQSHPFSVVNPAKHPLLITGLPHKLKILEQWKLGAVLLLSFGLEQARQSAEKFLEDFGRGFPNIEWINIGEDFRFGHQRKGDSEMLKKWAAPRDIQVHVVKRLKQKGANISSSAIREKILKGDLDGAAKMLGRPFSLYGKVVEGDRKGRALGFPTANLGTKDECIPSAGVYAGATLLPDGSKHRSVVNIGFRPTVASQRQKLSIETHLLDFSGNLYGEEIEIFILKKLREEKKFDSEEELRDAIQKDIAGM